MGKLFARWKTFLAQEKEKTKDMTPKKKLEYFFSYYKVEAFIVLVVLCLIAGGIFAIDNMTNTRILYIAVSDSEANLEQNLQFAEEFKQYIGNNRRKDKVSVDSNLSVLGTNEDEFSEFYEYHEKSIVLLGAGIVDVYVCEKAYVDFLEDYEDILPVREALGEELSAKYAASLDGNRALQIPKAAAEAMGISYEPSYLVFSKSVHYPEVARSFAQFLMEKG